MRPIALLLLAGCAAPGGTVPGEIRIRGTLRLTEPMEVVLPASVVGDPGARIVMAGPGPAIRIVGTHDGTANPRTVSPRVWRRERMPTVDGIEIVGEHPEASGIELVGTMQATITRVLVRRALHGIRLAGRNRNVLISGCHVYGNRGVGIYLDRVDLHQINIVGCHVSYNGGGGVVIRGGSVRNVQIGTCDIEANMAPDGPPTANVLFDVRDGSVREAAIVGCTLQHTRNAPDSANVRLLGRSAADPVKVGHVLIGHNAMSDAHVNIHLRHARGVSITGNTLWFAADHAIRVEGSSNVVVGPNVIDRNPDYPPGSRDGVLFLDSSDVTISGLHLNGAGDTALTLRGCRRFNVTGCSILDAKGGGLLLERCEGVRVSGCVIRGNAWPTRAVECTDTMIK